MAVPALPWHAVMKGREEAGQPLDGLGRLCRTLAADGATPSKV